MKKIAFIVQRYGVDINGGAELHCRQLAEHLTEFYDVEIITTKAIDYMTWKDYYKNDLDYVNNIPVHRFSVDAFRDVTDFNLYSNYIFSGQKCEKDELLWMEKQGPKSTALLKYLEENKESYDVFIFFTYLYYITFWGLQKVAEKAILIPTAHDEPPLHLSIFRNFFKLPQGIFYNTVEEKIIVENVTNNYSCLNNSGDGGVGIELPSNVLPDVFAKKYGITQNYIIYIGRIDASKGCDKLFQYFNKYIKRNESDLQLIVMGKEILKVPKNNKIVNLGFVSDNDKFNGLAGAKILIMPSEYESLSMVVLEAMALDIPVLVNGKCRVLKEHCKASNGGLYYENYFEFEGCINYLLEHDTTRKIMGKNGSLYVNKKYNWERIIKNLIIMIEKIA